MRDDRLRTRSCRRFVGALVGVLLVAAPAYARAETPDKCIDASEKGQKVRDEGKLREARDLFVICARPVCPSIIQVDCVGWLNEVQARTPSVVLAAKDEAGSDLVDVSVTMDGQPLLTKLGGAATPVDPGEHVFRFSRRGSKDTETRIVAREGEQRRLVLVTLARAPAPAPAATPTRHAASSSSSRSIPTTSLVLGGVALLSLGSFAYFYASGLGDRRDLEHTCAPTCSDALVDPARRKIVVADISLGVAAVAAVAAVAIYLVAPGSPPPARTAIGY